MEMCRLWELELLFERDDSAALSKLANSKRKVESQIALMLLAAQKRKHNDVVTLATAIMNCTHCPRAYAFSLQFALAASEIKYDLRLRERLFEKWQHVPAGAIDTYVVYLRLFSQAVTCYFESKFLEAGNLFDRCLHLANELNYSRGQMRSLLHLGLVNQERGFVERAQNFFSQSRAVALELNAKRFLQRFDHGLSSGQCARLESQLNEFLSRGEWQKARGAYLELERERRCDGQTRGANSYYLYQGILCAAFGKRRSYLRILRGTVDPAIKQRLLELKKKLLSLTSEEQGELDFIRIGLGMNVVIQRADGIEIAGIALTSVENEDVRRILLLLSQSECFTATKESICRYLWNYSYDPTIHDNRIYKLIHKCRQITRAHNLIVNDYGSYRLNAKYVSLPSRLSG